MKKQIALQMYTLRDSMQTPQDLENTLHRVYDMGYRHVQITPPAFTDTIALAAQLRRCGLQADSAICPLYAIPDRIEQIVRDCEALETGVLRTDSIRTQDRASEEGYRAAARHLEACGKALAAKGLTFMYHFHSFEFVRFDSGIRGIDILLQETDPQHVLFQPDVFWLTAAGCEPSTALSLFAGRVRYMHLKDHVIMPGADVLEETRRASAPVGTGNLNWPAIFRRAEELGIENYVVEDDMGVLDPFASAAASIQYLTRAFA